MPRRFTRLTVRALDSLTRLLRFLGHTVITDKTYCMEGTVQIEMLGPSERVLLTAGQSYAVPTNRPHRVTPHGDSPCRFPHHPDPLREGSAGGIIQSSYGGGLA